jgi:thiol-disulfide isomerase/thioredoxin
MNKIILAVLTLLMSGFIFSNKADASDNPLFVTITAEQNCSACKTFKPVLEELEYEYSNKVDFVTFDISTRGAIEESKALAEEKGLVRFFEENRGMVPKVFIMCPGSHKVEREFLGEIDKSIFREELESLLLDTSKICSL